MPVAQTETQLKVMGDVDALGEYLKASLEQITTEDYTLPAFDGSWQTGDDSRMGFRDLLRDTGLLCDAMQTDVAAQKNVDVDGSTSPSRYAFKNSFVEALRVWFRVVVYSHWQTAQIS